MTPKEYVLFHYPTAKCNNSYGMYIIETRSKVIARSYVSEAIAWEGAKRNIKNKLKATPK